MAILRNRNLKHVLYPNVFFEFGKFHIAQIIQNCFRLFSVEDICNCVEIWRMEHANNVLLILSDIFNDIDANELQFDDDMEDIDCMVDSEWADVRDDSLINVLLNDSNMSDINEALTEFDQSGEDIMDTSDFVNNLAVEVSQCIDTDN